MLVLTRKKNESIIINDNIEITIVDVQGEQVRIGINAPRNVSIYRKEVYMEIKEENKKASTVASLNSLSEISNQIKKK
jgi:carbon storage regulator